MNMDSLALIGQNITIVYQSLDPSDINGFKLKKILGKETNLVDMPGILVAIIPSIPLIFQFGDRRIRITWQGEGRELLSLWSYAAECHGLVRNAKVIAHGFNYDIRVATEEPNKNIMRMFIPDAEALSSKLNAEIVSFTPRIKMQRERTLYDIALEPQENKTLIVHFNAHFENSKKTQLSSSVLEKDFRKEYQGLLELLPRLFN